MLIERLSQEKVLKIMNFRKMHGLGNDFVVFDARTQDIVLTPEDMALVADRHWGVGCDLITVIDVSEKADVAAYFFNADGSESAACGNASRCVADIIMAEMGKDSCSIETSDRILACEKKGDLLVQVNMGAAKDVRDLGLSKDNVSNPVSVDMGNPHCVFFVDDLSDVDVETLGPYFETHKDFPNRSNIEFVQVMDKTHLRQVTWERGVGITQACGSGACAVYAAARHCKLVDEAVEIELDGGVLSLSADEGDNILMTGAVAYVFDGKLAD